MIARECVCVRCVHVYTYNHVYNLSRTPHSSQQRLMSSTIRTRSPEKAFCRPSALSRTVCAYSHGDGEGEGGGCTPPPRASSSCVYAPAPSPQGRGSRFLSRQRIQRHMYQASGQAGGERLTALYLILLEYMFFLRIPRGHGPTRPLPDSDAAVYRNIRCERVRACACA